MKIKYYNYKNSILFSIHDTSIYRYIIRTTEQQFQNFEQKEIINTEELDFRVIIGKFKKKSNKAETIIDDKYIIAPNYIYYKDNRKLGKWEIEINNLENNTLIKVNGNFSGLYTAPLNLIEFFIHYCLIKKNMCLLHAGAVVLNNTGILFSGRGGSGKTTITTSLLEQGNKFVSDNFILLKNNFIYNYLCPLNIFYYNNNKYINERLNLKTKITLKAKYLIYVFTNNYLKIFQKVNPTLIFNNIQDKTYLSKLIILEPKNDLQKIVIEKIQSKYISKILRHNMELDLMQYNQIILTYGYQYPNSTMSKFWDAYEKNVVTNLPKNCTYYKLSVPTEFNKNIIKDLINKLTNN
uniref:HPr kinase/phosphorylase C-terminal domain-containing protein n=1 Tax=uncultured verrucomicrobium HF0500_08N17 TaxID=723597 RepID=E7C4Y8_9BACT|nr:hypothetical protein [uncultured verrucomicrobium HF0500_08N17]